MGLGRVLHDAFAARMATSGITRVRCVTSPVNAESVAFHQHIGFTLEAQDEEYLHLVRETRASRAMSRLDPTHG
jgi:RimJ/RimL family protein N-acetyltransferase